MRRWLGLIDDETDGGTTFDDLATDPIPVPNHFVPVTTAQVDPGLQQLNRDNEVRGRRGNTAPMSFASAPSLTFEGRAYPKLVRKLIRKALSGTPASTGVAPAAITSTVGPIETGNLQALVAWLVREGQLDRLTGLVISELEFNFAIDEEGTVSVTAPGLYHDAADTDNATDPNGDPAQALPTPDYSGHDDTFMLRDATAYQGAAQVEIPELAGFGLTFNNGLIDDFRSRFRPGHNIEVADIDGITHKLWYPERHKIGAQAITGRLDFSDVQSDTELKRLFTHADKLVFEVAAGELDTTPAADEMLRFVCYKQVPTGGGADPIQREGDQVSSYEFTAYVSEADSSKDFEAVLVGDQALDADDGS